MVSENIFIISELADADTRREKSLLEILMRILCIGKHDKLNLFVFLFRQLFLYVFITNSIYILVGKANEKNEKCSGK